MLFQTFEWGFVYVQEQLCSLSNENIGGHNVFWRYINLHCAAVYNAESFKIFWLLRIYVYPLFNNHCFIRSLRSVYSMAVKKMFKALLGGNPFVPKNVTCLRICSVASFLIAVIYIIKLIFLLFTPSSLIIVVIFSLLGLFCLTLKDVFKQAISYKEENDWTV